MNNTNNTNSANTDTQNKPLTEPSVRSSVVLPDNYQTKPIKVFYAPLTGQERHHWVCPELAYAQLIACQDIRVSKAGGGEFLYYPGHNHETSQAARNFIIKAFLKTDAQYLIMCDNDTAPVHPKTKHVINMIDLAAWGLPIVACPVPIIKDGDLQWHLNAYKRMGDTYRNVTESEIDGITKVDAVGFGLVCIRRDVIETMQHSLVRYGEGPSEFVLSDCGDGFGHTPESLPIIMRSRRLDGTTAFGEDLLFCARAGGHGHYTYIAPLSFTCGHYHTMDYGKVPAVTYAMYGPKDLGLKHYEPEQLTGWEMSFQCLLWLREFIAANQPGVILELGSGLSTVVMTRAIESVGLSNATLLISIDEDEAHTNITTDNVNTELDFDDLCVSICHAALEEIDGLKHYDKERLAQLLRCCNLINLLVIDGPSGKYQSRGEALPFLLPYLSTDAVIMLDDVNRPYEAGVVANWITAGYVLPTVERVDRMAIMHVNPTAAKAARDKRGLDWVSRQTQLGDKVPAVTYAMYGPNDLGLKHYKPEQLTGWEMSFQCLLWLREFVTTNQPNSILELGSGLSTVVMARALENVGSGNAFELTSIDENRTHTDTTNYNVDTELVTSGDLSISICRVALREVDGLNYYDKECLAQLLRCCNNLIDLLVIDGPSGKHQSRGEALPFLLPYLSTDAVIVLDDVNRPYEAGVVANWITAGYILPTVERIDRMVVMHVNPVAVEPAQDKRKFDWPDWLGRPAQSGK